MPPPTLQVTLDPDAQAELERRYHTTRDAPTRTRYQMVLLNAQGHTPPQIARCSRTSTGVAPDRPMLPTRLGRTVSRFFASIGIDATAKSRGSSW